MLVKRIIIYLSFVLLIAKMFAISSCANIIPPDGGPKDTLPPVLLKAAPADSSVHFSGNKINFTFNEYVLLDNNWSQQVIISPNPQNAPYIESKLQSVSVKLKDTLLPNTTYSINFGNAIKDVNEGNIYKNFTYVFSTGDALAKGKLNGNVILAETGKIDSTLIAVLYSNLDDSAVKKLRPLYYTTINGKGDFSFNWLPAGKFNVFVLPNDYLKRYDDSTKVFAFLNEPVTIDSIETTTLSMLAFQQYKKAESGASNFGLPAPPDKKRKVDTSIHIRYATNLEGDTQDLLGNFELLLQNKIASFDSSQIILTDTNFNAVKNYFIHADSSLDTITLNYPWKAETYFKLIVNEEAFTDSAGHHLPKTDTLSFVTKAEKEYGSMRLRFMNIDMSKNPVLQLVSSGTVTDAIPISSSEIYRKLYAPGDYEMRILYDENKNGIWDTGNYDKKIQPEQVISIPRKLTIKANWDNEVNINLK